MKIVFTDYYYPDNAIEREILMQLPHVEIVDLTQLVPGGIKTAEALIPHVQDADALVVQFADISAKVIDSLKNCKIIVRYASGVDNIAVDAAKAKGITVSNVPDYCIEDVSTPRSPISSTSSVPSASRMHCCVTDLSLWTRSAPEKDRRCYGGTGRIRSYCTADSGEAAAIRFAHPRIRSFLQRSGFVSWVTFVSLDELLAQSDIVSIHAPLTAKTRHLIGKRELALMKKGAFLVNTSRGGLIDEHALVEALQEKHLGGVGLDVLDMPDTETRVHDCSTFPGISCDSASRLVLGSLDRGIETESRPEHRVQDAERQGFV